MQNEPKCNVIGLIIAFCCHHKCEYKSYVGKDFLKQCGFIPSEFTILCSIASWATCGSVLNKEIETSKTQNNIKNIRIFDNKIKRILINMKKKNSSKLLAANVYIIATKKE